MRGGCSRLRVVICGFGVDSSSDIPDNGRPDTRFKSRAFLMLGGGINVGSSSSLRTLGWLVPMLALGGIAGCLGISIVTGNLQPVFPPVDGAVSVSRACREPPAIYLFRATVIPAAIIGAAWWWAASGFAGRARKVVLVLGVIGVAGFFVYALALGVPGGRDIRRLAIYTLLIMTISAQLIFAIANKRGSSSFAARRLLLVTCALPAICLSLLPLGAWMLEDWDRGENFAEWHALWLMLGWFPVAGHALSARDDA